MLLDQRGFTGIATLSVALHTDVSWMVITNFQPTLLGGWEQSTEGCGWRTATDFSCKTECGRAITEQLAREHAVA